MKRDALSFFIAFLLHLLLIAALGYEFESLIEEKKDVYTKIDIGFKTYTEETPKPEINEKKAPPKKEIKKPEAKKSIKKAKPPKKEKPKVEKIVKQQKTDKEIVASNIKPSQKDKQVAQKREAINKKVSKPAESASLKNDREKEDFILTIKKRIEENKKYPRFAIKRGLEGVAHIEFKLCKDGNIKDIMIKSSHRIFEKSTKEAIEKSFPVAIPKTFKSYPITIKLQLVYKLV